MAGRGGQGRTPAPTALKLLHGARPDRVNTSEPQPSTGEIRCPDWLSSQAKTVWRRLAPDLKAKGVLTTWDVDAFARLCVLTVVNRDALKDVQKRGVLVKGDRGMVKNPALQIARDTGSELLSLSARFGLTPSDRSQLTMPTPAAGGRGANRLLS